MAAAVTVLVWFFIKVPPGGVVGSHDTAGEGGLQDLWAISEGIRNEPGREEKISSFSQKKSPPPPGDQKNRKRFPENRKKRL
jgi:hypothetical protein